MCIQRGTGALATLDQSLCRDLLETQTSIDKLFGPHACRAAVIALLHLHRKRLPDAERIHKDVVMFMIAPLLWSTRYDAEWRTNK